MNRSELTPLWNAANNSLSSTSSTVRASLLKRVMKDRRLSFSPCSMVNRLDVERLCLYPPMKLLINNLLNSSKELTEFGCIVVLKVAMWSKGSHVPSYESKEGILNFGGRGWPLMEVMKGESVLWTKSSTGFALLIFSLISSMTFLIWSISLFKCGTLHKVVPLDWLSSSIFPMPSWL